MFPLPADAIAVRGAFFGTGEGSVISQVFFCDGNEEHMRDCQNFASVGCSHEDVAGVICPTDNATDCLTGDVRLVDGTSRYDGRVEVCLHGHWGKICDDLWDRPDAAVVCRQLGFPSSIETVFATSNALNGVIRGGLFLLDDVDCTGNETSLLSCRASNVGEHNCFSFELAGVKCQSEFT